MVTSEPACIGEGIGLGAACARGDSPTRAHGDLVRLRRLCQGDERADGCRARGKCQRIDQPRLRSLIHARDRGQDSWRSPGMPESFGQARPGERTGAQGLDEQPSGSRRRVILKGAGSGKPHGRILVGEQTGNGVRGHPRGSKAAERGGKTAAHRCRISHLSNQPSAEGGGREHFVCGDGLIGRSDRARFDRSQCCQEIGLHLHMPTGCLREGVVENGGVTRPPGLHDSLPKPGTCHFRAVSAPFRPGDEEQQDEGEGKKHCDQRDDPSQRTPPRWILTLLTRPRP